MSEASLSVPVVLASGSAERRRLLSELMEDFVVEEPGGEKNPQVEGGSPEAVAVRRAEMKARDVARRRSDALVIAADTVVACNGDILGKPADREEAAEMLRMLTTYPQRVITGMCLLTPAQLRLNRVDGAEIEMREFSEEEIQDYVRDNPVCRWAGGYALQPDDPNVTRLDGKEATVRGLPLERLEDSIRALYPGWSG
ncbi:MAG: Maf family protein [Planctomycetota bacterium]